MGFLYEAEPMAWDQAMDVLKYVRDHGIEQFLVVFSRCRDIRGDAFRWGDEVEHGVFLLTGGDHEADRSVRVSLRSPEVLAALQAESTDIKWVPEYGRWMLESTPPRPYDGVAGVLALEPQLRLRRQRLSAALQPGEVAPTMTSMPLFGVGDFCEPSAPPRGEAMDSLFVPDVVMNPHPRFPALTKNIRQRRGGKVDIRRPLMKDLRTQSLRSSQTAAPLTVEEADSMAEVYADSMAFGMGACCLQVTMQAADLEASRRLYDQLAPLTPLMLALTAATPFLRGWLCGDDVRWGQIAQSVDDRTPAERGLGAQPAVGDSRLAGAGVRPLLKSRYDSIDCYIGSDSSGYNDVPLAVDDEHVHRLRKGGLDEVLAQHVAHLFARDPLVLFGDRIELDDSVEIDHWENLQSTNWQTLRWKPPPPQKGSLPSGDDDHIGWRVEFRSMEVQLTDVENTAFIAFVVIMSRVLLEGGLDLRIPMSLVEENMEASKRRDAYVNERFWFRTNKDSKSCTKFSLDEIFNGAGAFAGLIPLCREHLAASGCDQQERAAIEGYLNVVARRASGSTMTAAAWMRQFVMSHPAYEQDSRIPAEAAHDLVRAAAEIGAEQRACPELLGESGLSQWDSCSDCQESSCSSAEFDSDTSIVTLGSKIVSMPCRGCASAASLDLPHDPRCMARPVRA